MIKILYIPSGELLLFTSNQEHYSATSEEVTADYTKSHWKEVWEESPEQVIEHLCSPENESDLKSTHKIPTNIQLDPKEFDIIYE